MIDGNLIAQAPGDGEAIMVQPFMPDQTPFIQMNQALIGQQQQRALQRKREDDLREAQKEAWIKEMKGNHKYDPADRPVVEREQKRILDLIYNYDGSAKAKFAIDDAQIGIGKFINDSGSIYDQYLKKSADLAINGDRVYFNNEDKLHGSRMVNNAETLEDAFGVLGQRQANIEAFSQAEAKVADPQKFIAEHVVKLKPSGYDPQQVPTEFGYVTTNVPKYDPDALKNLGSLLRKENRSMREFYKTDEEIYNAMLPYQVKTEKPTAKGLTSDQKNKSTGEYQVVGNLKIGKPTTEEVPDAETMNKQFQIYKETAYNGLIKEKETRLKSASGDKEKEDIETTFNKRIRSLKDETIQAWAEKHPVKGVGYWHDLTTSKTGGENKDNIFHSNIGDFHGVADGISPDGKWISVDVGNAEAKSPPGAPKPRTTTSVSVPVSMNRDFFHANNATEKDALESLKKLQRGTSEMINVKGDSKKGSDIDTGKTTVIKGVTYRVFKRPDGTVYAKK